MTDGIEIFTYPATTEPPMPSWELWSDVEIGTKESDDVGSSGSRKADWLSETRGTAAWEARLAEEERRSFEAGRELGIQEGRAAEREAQAANRCAKDKLRIEETAQLVESFSAERNRYFEAVEHEVVKLALAVAGRILRREAHMDPLLLTGAVRVALGQLSGTTQVRLRVPAADLELWTDTIAHLPNLAPKPIVLAGEGMRLGDCVMETEMGSVDLGVRAQLGEIEHGFYDRAGNIPAATVAKAAKVSEDMAE
jgi:flagellar assembly protein FliH